MFETFGFEDVSAKYVSIWFGLGLGVAFGLLAQPLKFCFRRSLVGEDRAQAAGIWAMALIAAVIGTQAAVAMDLITFADHRFMATGLPILAILTGGALFGAGMVLTRGCISRLTVLGGTGNLRALVVLLVFALIAHATLKGVLAPLRLAFGSVTVEMQSVSLVDIFGTLWIALAVILAPAAWIVWRSGNRIVTLGFAALLGALAPLAWVGTGFVLFDDFDPIALESLSFTLPAAETLFWSIASTAIPAGFGTGLVGGVLIGAFIASLIFGGFAWVSFESPRQTGRYLLGAAFMGFGGVLAGGCTLGAGLSGVPTLSIAAIIALAAIALGGVAMNAGLNRAA